MWLSWRWGMVAAAVLAAATPILRRRRKAGVAAFTHEAALVFFLYGIWRIAGTWSVLKVDHALDRGHDIHRWERWLPLPTEHTVQRLTLPHSWLVQFANGYYALVHVPALIVFLLWLFVRHRDRYGPWRTTLALTTGACLLIQLVPVAPPRMFPGLGFVDTGKLYHQSVYGAIGSGLADQLSAMPSVHVAWAVLIGVAAVRVGRGTWRWVAAAHPVLTVFVVTATANHWYLDGIVACGIMAAAWWMATRAESAWKRWARPDQAEAAASARTAGVSAGVGSAGGL